MSDAPHGATTSRILDRVSKDARGLVERLQRLQDIGSALSSETDLGRLLSMILKESRALTNADSGTVYIREDDVTFHPEATARDPITTRTPKLAMKVGQNDSLDMPFKEIKLAFHPKTIAGFVATSGE